MEIPFYIESINGHDTKLVPDGQVVDEINKQVANNKWVTVEKKDGTTEMVTKPVTEDDLDEEDKELMSMAGKKEEEEQEEKKEDKEDAKNTKDAKEDWKSTFGSNVKSATSTNKLKGG